MSSGVENSTIDFMSIGVFLCFGLWLEIWQILEDVFAAPLFLPC